MKITVTEPVTREIETDDFTDAQWREFIKRYCTTEDISKAFRRDLFPFTVLKARAVLRHHQTQMSLED